MTQTSRELVKQCLTFEKPARIPRDMWLLPWAENHYPEAVNELKKRFPADFLTSSYMYSPSPRAKGDPYKVGEYTDEWGCVFINVQDGIIGEVKTPVIHDITDWKHIKPPYELLPQNPEKSYAIISREYENNSQFILAGCCPRPWERYQFLRGTVNAMMDVMTPEEGGADLLTVIHNYYMKELEFWVKSDVDAIMFMDDWGSQNQLLIPPFVWRELFKPLYKDYCDLAHAYGKFAFMHSDGHILEIYGDIIEVGVDAINSQLFCMDMIELKNIAKGRITFWGEIDRQHILPNPDPQAGRDAVRQVASHLYAPEGGIIAQFELGAGANPETAIAVFEEWEHISNNSD